MKRFPSKFPVRASRRPLSDKGAAVVEYTVLFGVLSILLIQNPAQNPSL